MEAQQQQLRLTLTSLILLLAALFSVGACRSLLRWRAVVGGARGPPPGRTASRLLLQPDGRAAHRRVQASDAGLQRRAETGAPPPVVPAVGELYGAAGGVEDPSLLPCYEDQLRLVYDRAAGDYRNVPGVVSFGTTRSFRFDDPAQKNVCMARLVDALEGVGYREGANLFGAPYDFRYAPAAPGVASMAFSDFQSSLRLLVERASARNANRPAILVTHNLGGLYATEFLNRSPLAWRRRYVKHLVMLCFGVGGSPLILQVLASSGAAAGGPPPATLLASVMSFGDRSFASTLSLLPSPKVYGDTPLVITRAKNYSARNMPEFLAAVGFSDGEVARYRTRALPVTLGFRAPVVPVTSINGVGVPTVERLVYWDGNSSAMPQVVNGDGDGIVSLDTVLALETFVGDDPDQRYFKSILVPNVTHNGMVSDRSALSRVVEEILEANRGTSPQFH